MSLIEISDMEVENTEIPENIIGCYNAIKKGKPLEKASEFFVTRINEKILERSNNFPKHQPATENDFWDMVMEIKYEWENNK